MGQHLLRREKLGLPQGARDVFTLLEKAGWIESRIAASMRNMGGFRNISLHNCQKLHLPIIVAIVEKHLDDFLGFSQQVLLENSSR